jgi:hypothetical protein
MVDMVQNPTTRAVYLEGHSLDDMIWHQAMTSFRNQAEFHHIRSNQTPNEHVLFELVTRGLHDGTNLDNPWPSSMRSMRYTAVMVDCLWSIVEREQVRVCVSFVQTRGVETDDEGVSEQLP